MEDQFIPYQQAKKLKELSFDEPCLAMYNSERELIGYTLTNPKTGGVLQDDIKVPLYQQAFDWFREKHNLTSYIKDSYKTPTWIVYECYILGLPGGIEHDKHLKAKLSCLDGLIEVLIKKLNHESI